ncbi:MAG: hypothetical protein DRJ05_14000, partial [Bacteroidetes bacterium]
MRQNRSNSLSTVLVIFLTIFISTIFGQTDTNFYQQRNYFFQGYQGEIDTNEGSAINQFRKYEYIFGPKFSPTGSVQKAANAIDSWIEGFELNGKENSDLESNWISLGPKKTPIYGGWASGTGRLACIEFDPIVGDNIIYVGSPYGGIWKSTNNGEDWFNLNTDHQLPVIGVSDIAINPDNNNMIFCATGNRDDYKNTSISAGIYRSTDGGLNWSPVNVGLDFEGFIQISKILITPINPDIAYIATSNGIFRTVNATTQCQWTALGDPMVHQKYFRNIMFKPDGLFSTIYASGKDILKSMTGGATWSSLTGEGTGLDFTSTMFEEYPFPVRINIDVTQAAQDKIYATAVLSDTEGQLVWNSVKKHFIFLYEDDQWTIHEPLLFSGETGYDYTIHGTGPGMLPIAVSPINEDLLFFGNVINWRS